jgi:guanine deaminase
MRVVKGHIVSFSAEGTIALDIARGALACDSDGRIAWVGEARLMPADHAAWPVSDHGNKLVMPGFIDAHIHFPQYRILAAPGKDLLDWLTRFTFPEEARYADPAHAAAAADVFLNRLHVHGTTSALAFSSVHKSSAEALFAAALKCNMALVTGKTMMDRNAIPAVHDTPETGARESEELYHAWHNKGRLRYAVTPRFAITSSEGQLRLSGELLKSLDGALMQTHISESAGEIAFVKRLFPNAKDYTDVYDHFGLLGPRSLFAHGIHLSEREASRFHDTGSGVIHCPTSNTFLGSGLLSMPHLKKAGRPVTLGLGTDVGGGTSYSMLATMAEAYKVQMLCGHKFKAAELFSLSTIGNAARLHMEADIGSIAPGKFADLVVLDPRATPTLASRHEVSASLEDVLFCPDDAGRRPRCFGNICGGAKSAWLNAIRET